MRAKAGKTDAAPATSAGRRSVLFWATLGLVGTAFAELGWIVTSFLRPRPAPIPKDEGSIVVAGVEGDFSPRTVTAVPAGRFYLVRLEDGGFLALYRRCPHLGCTVPWDETARRFLCPCHGSSFDMRGDVGGPPAPRPLDLFPVRIENGLVKVDVSRPIERPRFEQSQVVRS